MEFEAGIFFLFVVVGFFAQIIDGALGMAYGVINMAFLLSLGIPPAAASASIHVAEVFTTGMSGISHAFFKNIHFPLFKRIVISGMAGSIIGAYFLTLSGDFLKPYIAVYLIGMGLFILYKSFDVKSLRKKLFGIFGLRKKVPSKALKHSVSLGFAGGLLDAAGGGGWGGIVTTTLLAQNTTPRYTIGTVNFAEFLVALSSSLTFFFIIGIQHWTIVLGLLIGGVIAAPFGALAAKHLPAKILMRLVGVVVILVSIAVIVEMAVK